MAEAAVYYYETEIDWKGEKDLTDSAPANCR